MRTCQSCGKENPDDQDFCSCGEYLRWEPTGLRAGDHAGDGRAGARPQAAAARAPPRRAAAVTPAAAGRRRRPATATATATRSRATPPPPPPPPPPTAAPLPAAPPPPARRADRRRSPKTLVRGAVPPPAAPQRRAAAPHEPRDDHPAPARRRPGQGRDAAPGRRARPARAACWRWCATRAGSSTTTTCASRACRRTGGRSTPATVYLVPFGSGGTYEQEVEIHLHPPRSPEAEARMWDLQVVADSQGAPRSSRRRRRWRCTSSPTSRRPRRCARSARRAAARPTSTSRSPTRPTRPCWSRSTARTRTASCSSASTARRRRSRPARPVTSQMQVSRRSRSGSAARSDRRLEVKTVTGEEAAERAAAEPLQRRRARAARQPHGDASGSGRGAPPHVPGVYPPRVYKPQIYPPGRADGPGGMQHPHAAVRRRRRSRARSWARSTRRSSRSQLKMPGRGGAPPTPQAPLMPTQGVFRQKPWLPVVADPAADPAAARCSLLLLYKLLAAERRSCPNVVGQQVGVRGREDADQGQPQARPEPEGARSTTKATPGTVIGQTPAAGEKAKKDSTVDDPGRRRLGKVNVPNIVGQTAGDAEKALRAKNLTLGQASPQPVDPKGKISSQIPAAERGRQGGHAGQHLLSRPGRRGRQEEGRRTRRTRGKARRAAGAGAGAAGGRRRGGHRRPGDRRRRRLDAYAKKVADLGIVPQTKSSSSTTRRPARRSRPMPPGGTKVAEGREGDACSSPPASRRSSTPTARTSCASTAPPARSSTRSPTSPRRRDRPDVERRRHARRLHRRRPRDAQGHHQEERGRRSR